jgi:hypothetical protein
MTPPDDPIPATSPEGPELAATPGRPSLSWRDYRWPALILTTGLLILPGFVFDFTPSAPPSRRHFDRLWLGMPRSEVVALLGPPGNYDATAYSRFLDARWGGPAWSFVSRGERYWPYEVTPGDPIDVWQTKAGVILVKYDGRNRAVALHCSSPPKKVRWWGVTLWEVKEPSGS